MDSLQHLVIDIEEIQELPVVFLNTNANIHYNEIPDNEEPVPVQEPVPVPIINQEDLSLIILDLINGRANFAKHRVLLDLYNIICVNGGIIFGGASRDYIKRTFAAKQFYDFYDIDKTKIKYTGVSNKQHQYNNKDYHPESFTDRQLLPKDIDVYINEVNYKKLILKLNLDYHLKIEKQKDIFSYFFKKNKLFNNALEHNICNINFVKPIGDYLLKILLPGISNSNALHIKIDFIVLKQLYTNHKEARDGGLLFVPFGNPDFDVNQTYMGIFNNNARDTHITFNNDDDNVDNDGNDGNDGNVDNVDNNVNADKRNTIGPIEIRVNNTFLKHYYNTLYFDPIGIEEIKHKALQKIYKNIINSVAVPVFPNIKQILKVFGPDYKVQINYNRLYNMHIIKEYTINITETMLMFKHITAAPDDYKYTDEICIICLNQFDIKNIWMTFCGECKAKMHLKCYIDCIRKNPSVDEYNKITCPHCRAANYGDTTCPCVLANFVKSFHHKITSITSISIDKQQHACTMCEKNNLDNTCTKWYSPCRSCNPLL